jgi:hypothetical protein
MNDDNDDFDWTVFECMDCRVNTSDIGEFYMVQFELWASLFGETYKPEWHEPFGATRDPDYREYAEKCKGMLCIGCLEHRLGRRLVEDDFNAAPINDPDLFIKSERALDRMGW